MVTRALKVSVITVAILSLFWPNCAYFRQEPLRSGQNNLLSLAPTELPRPPATKNQNLPHKKLSDSPLSKSSTITGSGVLDLVAIITFLYLIIKPLIHVAILKHEISCHKNPPFQNPPCNRQKTENFFQNTNPENQYQKEQLIKETEKAIEDLREELREEFREELRTLKTKVNAQKEELENYVDNMSLRKYERDIQGQGHLFKYNYTKRFPQSYDGNS